MSVKKRKLVLALAVIFAVNILAIALAQSVMAGVYKKGSSGVMVSQIQTRLKSWGYYSGAVDGVYGSATEKAVRYFQSANGLAVDGQAGDKTLAALGLYDTGSSGSSGSSASVGAVVLNRIKHPSFPNSLSGVIYQSGAFSCIDDGQFNEPVADSAYRAANEALNGSDPTGGAIYYFNPVTATSKWIWSRPLLLVIGKHRFCS